MAFYKMFFQKSLPPSCAPLESSQVFHQAAECSCASLSFVSKRFKASSRCTASRCNSSWRPAGIFFSHGATTKTTQIKNTQKVESYLWSISWDSIPLKEMASLVNHKLLDNAPPIADSKFKADSRATRLLPSNAAFSHASACSKRTNS